MRQEIQHRIWTVNQLYRTEGNWSTQWLGSVMTFCSTAPGEVDITFDVFNLARNIPGEPVLGRPTNLWKGCATSISHSENLMPKTDNPGELQTDLLNYVFVN